MRKREIKVIFINVYKSVLCNVFCCFFTASSFVCACMQMYMVCVCVCVCMFETAHVCLDEHLSFCLQICFTMKIINIWDMCAIFVFVYTSNCQILHYILTYICTYTYVDGAYVHK